MGGVACIRGLRIPVATVVAMLAEGMTAKDILAAYPDLEAGDIREALEYAPGPTGARLLHLNLCPPSSSRGIPGCTSIRLRRRSRGLAHSPGVRTS